MEVRTLRRWAVIHKWTSLICTLFLLLICLTGLPLLFRDEINGWLEPHVYEDLPAGAPLTDLDQVVAKGRSLYPGQIVTSLFADDDEPQIYLWMAPSWAAFNDDPKVNHAIRFDARTGKVLEQVPPEGEQPVGFVDFMLHLHADLFADLPGQMFMAAMALLFIAAIVSGAVLYAPFARKLAFGTVRQGRSPRVKWLDLHNLLGVATLAWVLVVGATGAMNELSTPLFALWQATDVKAMLAATGPAETPAQEELASVEGVWRAVKRELPQMTVMSVAFPGSRFGAPAHFVVWTRGDSPLTSRLFNPVLVDGRSGEVTALVGMPWYLRALEVSRPLHFGDYGGMPLKILWALLDIVTIMVLGSGAYLWLSRRKSPVEQRLDELLAGSPAE